MINYDDPEGLQAVIISQRINMPGVDTFVQEVWDQSSHYLNKWIIKVKSVHAQGESRASPLHRALNPCMQWRRLGLCRAAQMGSWGDGCCQHTDQAVGRRSHCYSPRRHVQGMSDTFVGETHHGWIVVDMLSVQYWSSRAESVHTGFRLFVRHRISGVLIRRGAAHVISWWSSAGLRDRLSVFYRLRFWVTD